MHSTNEAMQDVACLKQVRQGDGRGTWTTLAKMLTARASTKVQKQEMKHEDQDKIHSLCIGLYRQVLDFMTQEDRSVLHVDVDANRKHLDVCMASHFSQQLSEREEL